MMKPMLITALFLLIPGLMNLRAWAQSRSDFKFTATAATFPSDKPVELKLRGTTRYKQTEGKATIEYKDGLAQLTLSVKDLDPPSQRQYTTYVFWTVTPEGFMDNIGEFRPRKRGIIRKTWGGTIKTATRQRTFCIVMTAEPHFLVESPSREVVLASLPPEDKEGLPTEPVEVHFRGDIGLESVPWQEDRLSTQRDREAPVELFEARRALDIGRYFNVEQHATREFNRAEALLSEAEQAFEQGADEQAAILARRAIITAEIARRLARERREAQQQRHQESLLADLQDRARQAEKDLAQAKIELADLNRMIEAKNRDLNELQSAMAELAAARDRAEETIKRLTETERQLREQLAATTQSLLDEQRRRQGLEEELSLLRQGSIPLAEHRTKLALARIAETRDEGDDFVIVLPNDRLFASSRRLPSGMPQLTPQGLAKLDAVAAILASYSSGEYTVEGYVTGPGSPQQLQALSQANAAAVVAYLLAKGVPGDRLKPVGRGTTAARDHDPQAQRQNQRVEIVIRHR